jgi:hypothetical protein
MQIRDNDYVPSMSGSSTYAYAVTQLERHGALHPDAHIVFQTHMYQAEPDVVAVIMTQLSLKAGLREWGKEAQKAVHSGKARTLVHCIGNLRSCGLLQEV